MEQKRAQGDKSGQNELCLFWANLGHRPESSTFFFPKNGPFFLDHSDTQWHGSYMAIKPPARLDTPMGMLSYLGDTRLVAEGGDRPNCLPGFQIGDSKSPQKRFLLKRNFQIVRC